MEEALQKSQNLKSPDMNGITYELWKHIHQEHKKNIEQFSIVKLMTEYFDDIQEYGMSETSNFSIGWMCPIYKKNDRNEIANYRPITILNSDYKILTKVLALRLAKVAPSLLHKVKLALYQEGP